MVKPLGRQSETYIHANMDRDLRDAVVALANQERCSIAAMIRRMIADYLERQGGENDANPQGMLWK